jgi:RNA polymerase sigma factor (sigma-70 family)
VSNEEFKRDVAAEALSLKRYALALTRDRDVADDLVQDTLARALSREHLFHGGSMRAWLFTILTNLDRNRRRSLAVRPGTDEFDERQVGAPADDPLLRRAIERGVAALPDEQREVLLLVALEGLSYREVAEVQEVPVGTVMSRLSRARAALRAALGGEPRPQIRRVK